ncbi:phosphate ABC transporter substrate-binding protein [bacterium]|nr:phosphate ABC transporter substrate-binding protein [bacterium]
MRITPVFRPILTILTLATALLFGSLAFAQKESQTRIVIDGSTTVGPVAKSFADYFMSHNPDANVTVSESGSGNGAKSLINGTCDIATMSRFMKPSEFEGAVQNGIFPVCHVVALDGLAVVVHESNPVSNLTVEQIRNIYLGNIKNWQEVGGPNVPIVVISRDTNSGTYETFEGRVMKGEKMAGGVEYVGSNGAARQRAAGTPAAIAYVGLAFLEGVKPLAVNGILPETQTVLSGRYPIARPLFLFTNGYPEMGTPLYNFVTIHLTEKGQEIIESIEFVPVTNY